jgi:uridine phosphorylase
MEQKTMPGKYHIDLDSKAIRGARVALLPGDPFRSEKIARAIAGLYGTSAIELSWKREFHSYLTEVNGSPAVVMSTGIGGPSTSIAIDELAQIGVRDFIRVGTTGAIRPEITVGDAVITQGAVRLDGASRHYAPIEFPAIAHHELIAALVSGAKAAGVKYHVGVTASSDTFYPGEDRSDAFRKYVIREFKGSRKEWFELGVLNYEMESATLLTMTASMGLRGACITGVINRAGRGKISAADLAKGERSVVLAAAHGLGFGDNPVFKGVYDWSAFSTGASLEATELVASNKADVAFNIAGGLHHAMADRASGFCYVNDAVVAIKLLVQSGRRVAYVDIDAHHGDGVEKAFVDTDRVLTDRVLTVSIHESGRYLFPGTGFPKEMGEGKGFGYAVNFPLMPGTDDALFLKAFNGIVPDFIDAFKPDVLVTQLGVDTFASDPLTHLELTTSGFEEVARVFKSFNLPWVALGGGGYEMGNVARAWTLAWAIMAGREVPDALPKGFSASAELLTALGDKELRDAPPSNEILAQRTTTPYKRAEAHVADLIDELKTNHLPLIKSA